MAISRQDDSSDKNPSRVRDVVLIGLFAVALALPSAGYFLGLNNYELLAENRRLAELPTWPTERASAGEFPAAFEKYFDDHFGFRSYLVGRDERLKWYGARTQVDIQIGAEDWLFRGTQKSVAGMHCINPIGAILQSWVDLGERRQTRLASKDIAFYWVLAPNKHTIYPDMLPSFAQAELAECNVDRLSSALQAVVPSFLDLRDPLRQARDEKRLYPKTDTHWNEWGAAHGMKRLIEVVRSDFPSVPELSLDDFEVIVEDQPFGGDLAARLGVYGEHYDEEFVRLARKKATVARLSASTQPIDLHVHSRKDRVIEFSTGRAELPSAVVFHDSYGFATMALLAEHFESVRFVNSNGLIDFALLDSNPPDLVISLFLEGKLVSITPGDESLQEAQESEIADVGKRRSPIPAAW